jgi:hypothetical protein
LKGKRDKDKREEQKKGKHTLKEKRKQKKIKRNRFGQMKDKRKTKSPLIEIKFQDILIITFNDLEIQT